MEVYYGKKIERERSRLRAVQMDNLEPIIGVRSDRTKKEKIRELVGVRKK